MSDALKKVLEESILPEGIKTAIMESWDNKIQEARDEIAAAMRSEFAAKYHRDRDAIVESLDKMARDSMAQHVEKLAEARKNYESKTQELQVQTRKSLREFAKFAHELTKKELLEFKQERQQHRSRAEKIHEFVNEQLARELTDFHDDRRKLVEERIQNKIDFQRNLKEARSSLITAMAHETQKFVNDMLRREMSQFKQDLIESRKKHFGMQIFEAFAHDYGARFFDKDREVGKLQAVIDRQQQALAESRSAAQELKQQLAENQNRMRVSQDALQRTRIINSLCESLTGQKRQIMEELLAKDSTDKLSESFKKYLPKVMGTQGGMLNEQRMPRRTQADVFSATSGDRPITESRSTASAAAQVKNSILGAFQSMENRLLESKNV